MATSLEESEKEVRINKIHANTFHLVNSIVEIGPADPEIIRLKLKKKLRNVRYIAQSASLPIELDK